MTTPDDVRALFDAARDTFEVEEGQPTESYITRLQETMAGILYTVRYDAEKGEHNLIGIVIDDEEYKDRYNKSFQRPKRPAAYDDTIKEDDKVTIKVRKAEAIHKARLHDWELYDVSESQAGRFIVDAVDDVWLAELKKKITIYAEVTASEMLEHLRMTCLGAHEVDILDLQDNMRAYHTTMDSIPQYIEAMERAQKQSKRANNEIGDAMLVNMATKAMLATERFPKANDDWEDLPRDERTWAKWKTLYKAADLKAAVKKKARDAQFGGAAPQRKKNVSFQGEDTESNGKAVTMDELEGCFDSLANAAVTSKDTLESLMDANTTLTKTNAKLVFKIKALKASLASSKANKKGNGAGGTGGGTKTKREQKWCPNCKRDTWHDPDDCFELSKNKDKRGPNWKSVFDKN